MNNITNSPHENLSINLSNNRKKTKQPKHENLLTDILIYMILTIVLFLFLFPMYQVLVVSISDPGSVYRSRGLMLWPQGTHLEAYDIVLKNNNIITGYKNTLIYLTIGVSIQYIVTILTAYALSIKDLPGRRWLSAFFVIVMYFNSGIIPMFHLLSKLKMLNTIWAITLPNAVSIFYIQAMRAQFDGIPSSLIDAAHIDGANDFQILFKVLIPLSAATSAAVMMYSFITYWNMWYEPMLYMTKRSSYPLQSVLREILIDNASVTFSGRGRAQAKLTHSANKAAVQTLIKYAVIVITTVPMVILYPFAQKYFVKGSLIGAVKE